MDKIAFVFSGQGAQYPGMGKDLYAKNTAAKLIFKTADSIRPNTSNQCFNGTKDELSETINTQPCVFCVDLAAAECLKSLGIIPSAVAGFSLGETAALTFGGVFDLESGFNFVLKRAEFMQRAAENNPGAMAAVLKLSAETVEKLCSSYEKAYPVNYNCKGQTVVALSKNELETFCQKVKESGGRAVPLAVSGGFHSPFMDEAAEKLYKELKKIKINKPNIPIYANLTSEPYGENIALTVSKQVNHPVYWEKTINNMIKDGINTFIEVGPGKTLCGLIRKISPQVKMYNVETFSDVENVINELGGKIC